MVDLALEAKYLPSLYKTVPTVPFSKNRRESGTVPWDGFTQNWPKPSHTPSHELAHEPRGKRELWAEWAHWAGLVHHRPGPSAGSEGPEN